MQDIFLDRLKMKKNIYFLLFISLLGLFIISNNVSASTNTDEKSVISNTIQNDSNVVTDSNQNSEKAIKNTATKENSDLKEDKDNNISEKKSSSLMTENTNQKKKEEVSIQEYNKNISEITKINLDDMQKLMSTNDNKDHIVYIGRPTCYYCRQFSPVINKFNKLINNKLLYFDIDADKEKGSFDYVFNTLELPGTPATLRIKNSDVVYGWIGGIDNAQDLYNSIFSEQANKIADSLTIKEIPSKQVHVISNLPKKTILNTSHSNINYSAPQIVRENTILRILIDRYTPIIQLRKLNISKYLTYLIHTNKFYNLVRRIHVRIRFI